MPENFINGSYVASSQNESMTLHNPATNEPIDTFYFADSEQLQYAIDSALSAQRIWQAYPQSERIARMQAWAALVKDNQRLLAECEVMQTGKPIQEALNVDLPTSYGAIEYYAGLVPTLKGHYQELDSGLCMTRPEPLGVIGAIGAWNYPLQIACWKMAPAIAAGNAVVFKPSEFTPLTALHLAELAVQAGLPNGLVNVVYGASTLGEALVSHSDVAKISFTGSVNTGKSILKHASKQVVPTTLELGGKSALIIFEDADVDKAVTLSMMANFYTQGAVCSNASRVFVHKNLLPEFLKRLKQKTQEIRVGLPMLPSTQMGALIHVAHMRKVQDTIQNALKQGATCLCGGSALTQPPLDKGNFMQPTVLINCHDEMDIVKEEHFGPVMTVLPFVDEQDVIKRANHTPYGLAAGVVTENLNRAHRVINALDAGTCWINHYNVTPLGLPFGGVKQSGFGRENAQSTLLHYTRMKTIYVELGELPDF